MFRALRASIVGASFALSACGSNGDTPSSENGTTGSGGGASSASSSTASGGPAIQGDIVGIDAGRYHSCLVTKSGAVYCWGQGAYGALGNNGSYKGVPTKALVIDDAIDVHCGGRFTCARRKAGTLFCWGEDEAGQLGGPQTKPCGDAMIDSVCAPVPQVVKGIENAVGIALGSDHACALSSDGKVSCWGENADGQLGNATLTPNATPTLVAGVQGATQITAGDAHTCALVGAGKVMCWGKNADAQIGSGSVTDREPAPIEVAGITDAVEIEAGGEHTCARRANGSVVCWGYDYFGELGNGSKQPTRASSPVNVVGLNDAVELALGRYHSCARRAGGTIACWGYDSKGELGDGTTNDHSSPTEVLGITNAASVVAGSLHTCSILASGPVMCWGDDLGGQLGIDGVNKVANSTPVPVKALPQ